MYFLESQSSRFLYTSESGVYRRHILTYIYCPRTERKKLFVLAVDRYFRYSNKTEFRRGGGGGGVTALSIPSPANFASLRSPHIHNNMHIKIQL